MMDFTLVSPHHSRLLISIVEVVMQNSLIYARMFGEYVSTVAVRTITQDLMITNLLLLSEQDIHKLSKKEATSVRI